MTYISATKTPHGRTTGGPGFITIIVIARMLVYHQHKVLYIIKSQGMFYTRQSRDDMQGQLPLMIYTPEGVMIYQTLLRFGLNKKEPKLKWIQFWFFLAEKSGFEPELRLTVLLP